MGSINKRLITRFFKAFIRAIYDVIRHDGVEHAGYLSFITILSLFPFLIIFISLAGALGDLPIVEEFIKLFLNSLPKYVENAIQPRIHEIISGPPQSIMTVAILGALWTASSFIEGLRTILNRAYRVSSPPPYLLRRLLSILQFILMTIMVILILVILLVLPPLLTKFFHITGININDIFITIENYQILKNIGVLVVLLSFVVSLNFFVTNIKLSVKELLPGSVLVVCGWLLAGKSLRTSIFDLW